MSILTNIQVGIPKIIKCNSLLKTSYPFCSTSLILQKTLQMYEIERGFKGQGQM